MSIKVIDSIMGTGKTEWAFKYMKDNPDKKYIYVTLYLSEIERLIGSKDNETSHYKELNFRQPIQLGEGKLDSFHKLLEKNMNIATTHALFKSSNVETIELIKKGNYTLILDEVMDVAQSFEMSKSDYNMLIDNHTIYVDEKGTMDWVDDDYNGEFYGLKKKCENGDVTFMRCSNNILLLMWNFNYEMFTAFDDIYILTYLFNANLIKYYFDINDIEYDMYSIENLKIIPFADKKPYDKSKLRENINIYNGKLNDIGKKRTALSLNWFRNNPSERDKLRKHTSNYFKNIIKAKSSEILWTTFKNAKKYISGKGYMTGFISINIKATNEYSNKITMAYLCNRFMNPDYTQYFIEQGVKIEQDAYALSELLQWIWRGRIRNGEPINIYIPSKRMRTLLINWLNDENI